MKPLGLWLPFSQADSYSSKSLLDDKYHKHAKNIREKRVEPGYPPIKSRDQKDRKQRIERRFSTSGRSVSSTSTLPSSAWKSVGTRPKALNAKTAEPQLPVPQTGARHYTLAIAYRRYRLSDCSPRYDDTVLSYIAELVEKVKLQMEAHFSIQKTRSIIGFLAAFVSACDSTETHEGALMWILPHYVQKSLANALNSRMFAKFRLAFLAVSVRNEQHWSRKLLCLYQGRVNYFLNTCATDQAIADFHTYILRYKHPAGTTFQQYASDQFVKSPKVAFF